MKRIQRFIFGAELSAGQKVMALLYPLSWCLIFFTECFYTEYFEYGSMATLLIAMYFIFLLAILFPLYCIPVLALCFRLANRTSRWGIFYLLPWILPVVFVINFILLQQTETSLRIPKGADEETVEILWGGYIKDKNHVWYKCQEITDADAASFENLGYDYAKDSRRAYYQIYSIEDVELASFQAEGKLLAKDKGECYVAGIPVGSTDPQSFKLFTEVIRNKGIPYVWGIDKDSIYFINDYMFSDYTLKKFKTSDYKRFHPLKDCGYYAVDGCHIYAGDSILDMADLETFHIVDGFFSLAQDKYRVYWGKHSTALKEYNPDNWQRNGTYLDGTTLYDRNLNPVSAESDSLTSPRQN